MSLADTFGVGGVYTDPLWRIRVELTAVERDLLQTWWVRRLGFVAHAGAVSIATTQTYTRLEHSLGLLALVAHLAPDDHDARVAALLHDVGHLPFSHTVEGVGGLDHHALGRQRVAGLADVLHRHGFDHHAVSDTVEGARSSSLRGTGSGLRLDHLDSFVRSGRAHGRTTHPPAELLSRLRLTDGAVDTDAETARQLRALVVGEAHGQADPLNLITVGVMRDLAARLIDPSSAHRRSQIADLTDDAFWGLLLSDPRTRDDAERLRRSPWAWRLLSEGDVEPDGAISLRRHRYYLDLPLVDGVASAPIDPSAEGLPPLSRTLVIVRT